MFGQYSILYYFQNIFHEQILLGISYDVLALINKAIVKALKLTPTLK
jgi:hypothetical protein